tara:strand:+ start:428 stop:1615 length:1188 start_codon:yes stop_codon:yes gene_type:complete
MKVLHLVAGDLNKGAAFGAYILHKSLLKNRVESTLLFTGKANNLDLTGCICISNNFEVFFRKIRIRLWRYFLLIFYNHYSNEAFSSGLGVIDIKTLERKYKPDIIHLHWINQSSYKYNSIKNVECRVIWTLRDMWPMVGGHHYDLNYETNDQDKRRSLDISKIIFDYKKKHLSKKVEYVCISKWIKDLAETSPITKNNQIYLINNSVDTKNFFKDESQPIIQFKDQKKLILLGAINLNAKYKGAEYAIEAIQSLDREKYAIASFGKISKQLKDNFKSFQYTDFGQINSRSKMREIFSSSDIYLFPSIAEAFGKTVVESILCETPVVAFNNSGPSEIIEHKVTGYLTDVCDVVGIKEGIDYLSDKFEIDKSFVELTKKRFSPKESALKYINLYNKL